MTARSPSRRSPTPALLLGLVITLATVAGYSWSIFGQFSRLQQLQTDLTDRNRRDSLQLLRIQNDLNQLGLAMRDMLDDERPYPLVAWSGQFERIRKDLGDAIDQQTRTALAPRTPDQNRFLTSSLSQFWDAVDRMFAAARAGDETGARAQVRDSLQERQASLTGAVARLLVQNNEKEADTASRVQAIYRDAQRQVIWFLAAALTAIVATSLYLIHANRRLFARMASLSEERRELAATLIATRESTLRDIARELHDELGQLLTAIGSMLGRAAHRQPSESPLRGELREIGEVAQAALDNVRGLSQALHPSILEDVGLDSAIVSYVATVERQLGVTATYERHGEPIPLDDAVAIQVYRVLQEALSNVARHAGTGHARVHLRFEVDTLVLVVEDAGRGLPARSEARGIGLITMRERAALLDGTLTVSAAPGGGTRVQLTVPIGRSAGQPPRPSPS